MSQIKVFKRLHDIPDLVSYYEVTYDNQGKVTRIYNRSKGLVVGLDTKTAEKIRARHESFIEVQASR